MKANYSVIFLILLAVGLSNCKSGSDSKKDLSSEIDSVKLFHQALRDSIQSSWQAMIEDDNEKIFHIKRLLKEIEYTNRVEQAKHDSLLARADELLKNRYDQETMADSELIDSYDSTTQALINAVGIFNFLE
jgi:hypothetical protein